MNARFLTGSGLGLALVLFLAVNVFSNVAFRSARFDLTDQKLFTLSDGTEKILEDLQEPITLRFYLSKKLATGLPGINSYANRVLELLQEYEQTADGQLILRVIDPEPFSEDEDRAVGYGLKGIPLNNGKVQFYFGLVGTSSTDDQEIIVFFQPDREEFLEYDVTKLVYQLAHQKQKVVGLLSTLPMKGGPARAFPPGQGVNPPWLIYDAIGQMMNITSLEAEVTKIPDEVDVLMVVHPKKLSDDTLYAIDQFVLKGGRALVFVDPHGEAEQVAPNPMNPMAMQGPRDSDLAKVFDAWGIELVSGKVVGDLPLAKKVNFQKQSRIVVADYPIWIDLTPNHFNPDDVVTAKLPNLSMGSAGLLRKKEGSTIEFTPLVQSDEQAMQIDTGRIQFMPDVEGLLRTYRAEGEKFTMAARITGTVQTAFPERNPSPEKKNDQDAAKPESSENTHLMESAEPINVIVVADTDLLQDRFWVQVQNFLGQRIGVPTAANGDFVTNALDNLTGSNDLISVRSRGSFSRPFTLVRALQQEAEQRYRQKEQVLQQRLKDTERKIRDLQKDKEDQSTLILSTAQQDELDRFRQELVATRKELRGVQHELQKNIEGLEGVVKFLNIGLMPLVIAVGGVMMSAYRMRRRQAIRRT